MKSKMGAIVKYCGHEAVFVADVFEIGNAVAIYTGRPIEEILMRDKKAIGKATHHVIDFPKAGLWKPRNGVLVVPADQVELLK